jgi:16S rRNA processing protein RimM
MQDHASDSPNSGGPEFLAVGRLRRPHGIRGEILMSVWTGFPERLEPGDEVYVGDDHKPVHIRSVRWHRDAILISFDEYQVREDVGVLRNQVLMVRTDDLPPLDEGELYLHQVIGMTVIDNAKDSFLGTITEIIETGANDVYIVRNEHGFELLIPAIDSVILDINIETNEMRVHLLPGLLLKTE